MLTCEIRRLLTRRTKVNNWTYNWLTYLLGSDLNRFPSDPAPLHAGDQTLPLTSAAMFRLKTRSCATRNTSLLPTQPHLEQEPHYLLLRCSTRLRCSAPLMWPHCFQATGQRSYSTVLWHAKPRACPEPALGSPAVSLVSQTYLVLLVATQGCDQPLQGCSIGKGRSCKAT